MKWFSKAKKEIVIVCALFSRGCRGTTQFRQEFEVFLCEIHHEWATKRRLDDFNFQFLYILCLCHIDNSYFSMSDGPGFAGLLDNLQIEGPTKAMITITSANMVVTIDSRQKKLRAVVPHFNQSNICITSNGRFKCGENSGRTFHLFDYRKNI